MIETSAVHGLHWNVETEPNILRAQSNRLLPIRDLPAKLKAISTVAYQRGLIASGSLRELVNRLNLEGPVGDDIDWYGNLRKQCARGRISPLIVEALVELVGFDTTDVRWDDPASPNKHQADSKARDTGAAFYEMLCVTRARVAVDLQVLPPQHRDRDVATFSLQRMTASQISSESVMILDFRASFEPFQYDDFMYGFSEVRLTIARQNRHVIGQFQNMLGEGGLDVGSAILECHPDPFDPKWFLRVENGILDGQYHDASGAFCEIVGAYADDEFVAQLSVRTTHGAVCAPDGGEIEDTIKAAIFKALGQTAMPDARDANGYFALGTQRIRVIRRRKE